MSKRVYNNFILIQMPDSHFRKRDIKMMKKVLSVVIALLVLSLCVSCLAVLVSAETSQAGDTAGSASQQIETSAQPSPQAAAGENEDRAAGGTGAAEAKANLGEDPSAPSPANGSSGIIAFSLLAVIVVLGGFLLLKKKA